jgi:hypothetical protein
MWPKVVAPINPGVYRLEWDMVSGSYWFSEGYGGWPTQAITVSVQQSPDMVVLPYIKNDGNWISVISIHNPSTVGWALANVTYITANGAVDSTFSYPISPTAVVTSTPPFGFFGKAVVAAAQDIDVEVQPSPEQIFLPLVLKN